MKTKTFLKRLLSVTLGLCVLLTLTLTPAVSAESPSAINGAINTTIHLAWTAEQASSVVNFAIQESAFYTLSVDDALRTGCLDLTLTDGNDNYLSGYYLDPESIPFTSAYVYLAAGKTYSFTAHYLSTDDYSDIDANISICLQKTDYEAAALPTGALATNGHEVDVNTGSEFWYTYTPSVSGDYSVQYEDLHAYFTVFDAKTGVALYDYIDTEYWDVSVGEWFVRTPLIFALEADNEYLLRISNYGEAKTHRFSIIKSEKDLEEIRIEETLRTFDGTMSGNGVDEHAFTYRVDYSDDSSEVLTYKQLSQKGYSVFVFTNQDVIDVNGETFWQSGKTPAVLEYNNKEFRFYVDVLSMVDLYALSDPITDGYDGVIEYIDREEHNEYWRVRMNQTGTYQLETYTNNPLENNFDEWTVTIIDTQNQLVNYDPGRGGWPLLGGKDYVLSFSYRYNNSSTADVLWSLGKANDSAFPDTHPDGWYNDAVLYAFGRQIITGYQNGNFGVADGIDRQDFMLILARYAGVDLLEYSKIHGQFSDVAPNSYYEAAVNWAYDVGITTGYQDGRFGVSEKMSREQLVTFLYRFANRQFVNVDVTNDKYAQTRVQYEDYGLVSDWAEDAIVWAIDRGIIRGNSPTRINPLGGAQRCEIAQIMYNIHLNEIL